MKEIVVLGSTNTDMVVTSDRLPVLGESVSGGSLKILPGGKGANQAVAVARLSRAPCTCEFIGKVGDDAFGRETGDRLRQDKILPKLVVDPDHASGTALVLVDAKGLDLISVALGANGTLSVDDIGPYREDIEKAKVLLMQLETPIPTVVAAARWAHAAGVTVVLNPAPATELPDELYSLVDWSVSNEVETGALTGVQVTDAETARAAAAVLKSRGVAHVLITMGDKGCYCSDCDTLFPCVPVRAVDCVGAGDTFCGAFVVALEEGLACADAIAFAQKAAALAVTRFGAQRSIPTRHELTR